ncbi:MAG: WD40 repeat domain-containing protein [Planctomycetes bacterium]|nr:WD40 repeat domain-containing protein [Planctomycetota bacterium]
MRKLPSLYVRAHAHHIIFSTDVSPDAKQLAVEFSAGYVLCCDLATFQAESFFAARDEKAEPFVKYLHDNKTLATSAGGSLRLFDLGTLTERRDTNILHGRRWAPFDVSHNDRVIAIVSGKDALTLWNLESREPIDKLRSSHGDIRSFRFAPKNEVLAIGTSQGAILLCDTNAPDDDFRVLTHGSSPVESVAFSPDGKQLASADPSGATRIWDVAEGSEVAKLDQGAVTVAFSHDGKMLATGYDKDKPNVGHVTLWSTETWEPLTTWQEPGYMQKTLFASDGKLVVLTDASYVSVWDVPTFLENLPSPQ